MKVLRVLGLVFGILLLLTGGGLLLGAAAAEKGQDSVQQEIAKQGLKGPVDATVVSEENSTYTVTFTAEDGTSHTATAVSTLSTPPKVGDTVSIFYKADDPSVAAITDAPVNALSGVAGTLTTAGIVTLVVGGLLLVAGILGFVLGKKTPKPVPGQPYAAAYPGSGAPAGYPAQNGPVGYPAQPGGNQYPPQGPGAYPSQGAPGGYPTPPGTPSAPTPPQQYPAPPAQYPPSSDQR
ncbi:DUF3592 domain-containing protein [Microlunatus ginsengisoli]|uniref:DUF3592 domain-containing protein n=1 Tax=Microlunatus ginsengisoli TaxID=363863 RepID=A0ABP7AP10_9ACTN